MIRDRVDEMVIKLGDTFEETQNTLQMQSQLQLMSFFKTPNQWQTKQLGALQQFKNSLVKTTIIEIKKSNQQYDDAYYHELKVVKDNDINEDAKKRLALIKKQNTLLMMQLSNQIFSAHQKFVNEIGLKVGQQIELAPMEKTNFLYEQIVNVINSKGIKDEVNIVYSDGKKMPFKSYMEMNARTTLNQEIGKQQMETATDLGVVFWLCNSFADCRPTHQDYQGKVYFDERWESYGYTEEKAKLIRSAIDSRGMQSRQAVENENPFLGNCPNCRHEFVPVPIQDVVDMTDTQLLNDNNMNVDKSTQHKYELSQEQRAYERAIRNYKYKVQQNENLLANAPKYAKIEVAQKQLNHDKMMLDRYYGKIRTLVKENPSCERDYNRENAKVLRENLGAKYKK